MQRTRGASSRTSGRRERHYAFWRSAATRWLVAWGLCGALLGACSKDPSAAARPEAAAPQPGTEPASERDSGTAQRVRALSLRPGSMPLGGERLPAPPGPTRSPIEQAREHFPWSAPTIPLQEVACNETAFVRLTDAGFEAFRTRPRIERVARHDDRWLDSALAIGGRSYVLLGREAAYRYYEGQRRPVPFARIPQLGLTSTWPDGRDFDAVWVRYARDGALYRYPLQSTEETSVSLGEERRLPGFDGCLVQRLSGGAWVYTQGEVLRVTGGEAEYRVDDLIEDVVALAPARRLDRFWAFGASGQAVLIETSRGRPVRRREQFSGLPYSVAVREDVVAAVVIEMTAQGRQWWLEVVRAGSRQRWELPKRYEGAGSWEQQVMANRDVCLLGGHPWAVIGGRSALEVYDYSTGELLLSR